MVHDHPAAYLPFPWHLRLPATYQDWQGSNYDDVSIAAHHLVYIYAKKTRTSHSKNLPSFMLGSGQLAAEEVHKPAAAPLQPLLLLVLQRCMPRSSMPAADGHALLLLPPLSLLNCHSSTALIQLRLLPHRVLPLLEESIPLAQSRQALSSLLPTLLQL